MPNPAEIAPNLAEIDPGLVASAMRRMVVFVGPGPTPKRENVVGSADAFEEQRSAQSAISRGITKRYDSRDDSWFPGLVGPAADAD